MCVSALWIAWKIANARAWTALHRAEASLKREIDKELPLGPDRARVEEFLGSHSIESAHFSKLASAYKDDYEGASGLIFAATGRIKTPIYDCKLQITFRFDEAGNLEGYTVKPMCWGPFG